MGKSVVDSGDICMATSWAETYGGDGEYGIVKSGKSVTSGTGTGPGPGTADAAGVGDMDA